MKRLIPLFMVVATCYCVTLPDVLLADWTEFKLEYGKKYKSKTEENFHMNIFLQNKEEIAKHNAEYELGMHTYTLGINQFSDMLQHEVSARMNNFKENIDRTVTTFIAPANVVLPDHVDWREKGAVTPVKNQKFCVSDWAFSVTGALEGQHFLKTGKLVSLSEQNLLDCTRGYGNKGCDGGEMTYSYDYIRHNGGIDTEESYPYEAKVHSCRYNNKTIGATCSGYVKVSEYDEDDLQRAVATVGPISVAIDADDYDFIKYKSGIYCRDTCRQDLLNHAPLVVGYGTDEKTNMDYWLVKNSWGRKWGEDGYVRLCRNQNNRCGIATYATYPLV